MQLSAQRDFLHSSIDVQHYTFSLVLNDENNSIQGAAVITVLFVQPVTGFDLDLVKKNTEGKGMTVTSVRLNNQPVQYIQADESIYISTTAAAGETKDFTILYEGIPADGLIIDKNKYNHRSFFGDNWPNRAHHWLPCVDNPADKAAVDFIVTAPEHYQIISNGIQVEENNLPDHLKQTHWRETVALPTKVMVIGAADFAVNYAGDVDCIPVYSWVYPEDREKGFYDYSLASDILPFFIKQVGPYAYHKLANVQSKTRFGGMENASAIFYAERSVAGDRKVEALLTHEIAHQWFGNMATEKSWPHVWLSEGFATYMTHCYLEKKYGTDSLQKRLQEDRQSIIAFSKKKTAPVVDTTITSNFFQLLNANSYQKGGWALHMLRNKLGDAAFWQCIRTYYAQYAGSNASTEDLRKVMETVSGQDLQLFFQQWLFTAGHPILRYSWKYNTGKKLLLITIEQEQVVLFNFPLEILIEGTSEKLVQPVDVKKKTTTVTVALPAKPLKIILDPGIKLLFEEAVQPVK